ncbi:hypothetical protein BEWA_003340 [Theileria equi strain WA]|uniref:Uncharacterized protein n=1 Tax=Theileria equi strain WA TaxID=1537102 RepID=L0B124_THEEQ|nr:hypothetical protein BEWA_003340 [Theileria equi strain WA]AFZ80926.1 hypothetical protein BEWA_003340 [Theileria equi strain WA]|eukprot:XP_004830592.1 hypothetical protein BEWA_003340 [Theileria equi strain WA]
MTKITLKEPSVECVKSVGSIQEDYANFKCKTALKRVFDPISELYWTYYENVTFKQSPKEEFTVVLLHGICGTAGSSFYIFERLSEMCSGPCRCTGGDSTGITARREITFSTIRGFIAYVHEIKGGGTFTLKGTLDGGDKLGDNGDITDVTSVSVYYWDEDDEENPKPLILEVEIGGNEKKYYIKYESNEQEVHDKDAKIWVHHGSSSTSLQDMLDDRNCAINKRVPLDIKTPEKTFNFSSGRSKGKGIELAGSKTLLGSDYMVTSYRASGGTSFELKLSRVDYENKKITEIKDFHNALDGVRLYSSPVNGSSPPVVLELATIHGGNSTLYASKGGNSWVQVYGDSKTFYTGEKDFSTKIPTEALTNKLDEVICTYHNAATVDISYSNSQTHTGNGNYCCNGSHGPKRISVIKGDVTVESLGKTTSYYKHSIESGKLADIKFYLNGDQSRRRRVRSSNLRLPITGPVDVYAFYCGYDPILVYVDDSKSTKAKTGGWFRRSRTGNYDKKWAKFPMPRNIKPETINNCKNWNTFVAVLEKLKCENFQRCPPEPLPLRSEDGIGATEIQDEEQIALGESDTEDSSQQATDPGGGRGEFSGPNAPPGKGSSNVGKGDDDTALDPAGKIGEKGDSGAGIELLKTLTKLGLNVASELGPVVIGTAGLAEKVADKLLSNVLSPALNHSTSAIRTPEPTTTGSHNLVPQSATSDGVRIYTVKTDDGNTALAMESSKGIVRLLGASNGGTGTPSRTYYDHSGPAGIAKGSDEKGATPPKGEDESTRSKDVAGSPEVTPTAGVPSQSEPKPEVAKAAARLETPVPSLGSKTSVTDNHPQDINTPLITVSSVLATSAGSAATFFGGWKLYNRYKGDPWGFRCISAQYPEYITPFEWNAGFLHFLEYLKITKPVVFASDLGGFLLQLFAEKYPDAIHGMILCNSYTRYIEDAIMSKGRLHYKM